MGKKSLIQMFNYKNKGSPGPEMQLIAEIIYSFIPFLVYSECQYNQQHSSDLSTFQLLTKVGLLKITDIPER